MTGPRGTVGGRWVPVLAFVLFVAGFWATGLYITTVPVAERLDDVPEFGVWAALLAALGGFAPALLVYSGVWLTGLVGRSRTAVIQAVAVLVVLGTVFATLFELNSGVEGTVDADLTVQTRPVTVVAALCLVPGLAAFLAVRSVAAAEGRWRQAGVDRLRLILRLRAELRRLLAAYGAFLTLLVVATGMRRRALLAYEPDLALPAESVLLYGLLFAVLLGLFYAAAATALDRRAGQLLDEFAPLPDPADAALSDRLQRRAELGGLIGVGGSWRSFETTVVIAAPLLTAFLGIATGD